MSIRALIIDDDSGIVDEVADIVESLGHVSERATCMESALRCLNATTFAYVVLDLGIPVRTDRGIPRPQNGLNLLKRMRETSLNAHTPVITMTAHGTECPEMAVAAFKAGTADYIWKPLSMRARTLDQIIVDLLSKRGAQVGAEAVVPRSNLRPLASAKPATKLQPLMVANLVYFDDRVELEGVEICGAAKSGILRTILETLRETLVNGRYKPFSGEDLAKRTACQSGQNAAAGAIRRFRRKAIEIYSAKGIQCGMNDVIENNRKEGYRFTQGVQTHDGAATTVEVGERNSDITTIASSENENPEMRGHLINHDPVTPAHGPINDTVNALQDSVTNRIDPADDPVTEQDDPVIRAPGANRDPATPTRHSAIRRQNWVIDQLRQGCEVRRDDVEKRFGVSSITAKRDLRALVTAGAIEYFGPQRTGQYRLVGKRR